MGEKHIREKVMLFLLVVLLFLYGAVYAAENIDPLDDGSQYAYGENVGWLNAEPNGDGGDGVEVGDTELAGYIWGENIGWINLSPTSYGGVTNDGDGNLSGYAWGENVGWINFDPNYGGVTIDGNGDFDGWAWGENIGWIHFKSESPVAYKVQTGWTSAQEDTDGDGVPDSQDNCPNTPNGPDLGTCINCGDVSIGSTCTADAQCTDGFCSMHQEDYDGDNVGDVCETDISGDTYPPGGNDCIDICECEADFDGDGAVAANDVTTFLDDFGRSYYNEECVTGNPCNGDFDCDGAVAANDVTKFLEDFGRNAYNKPCPIGCQTGAWCSY